MWKKCLLKRWVNTKAVFSLKHSFHRSPWQVTSGLGNVWEQLRKYLKMSLLKSLVCCMLLHPGVTLSAWLSPKPPSYDLCVTFNYALRRDETVAMCPVSIEPPSYTGCKSDLISLESASQSKVSHSAPVREERVAGW